MNDELSTFNPEARFQEAPITIDPGDFYAAPLQLQDVLHALMEIAGVEADATTLIAFGEDAVGFWHHNAAQMEQLTHWDRTGTTTYDLGPMDRADV